MGDTLITVIAIALAAVLMFVFPLMTMSDRTDDVSQLAVETATTDFVDDVRTTGKLTQEDYDNFILTIGATGNAYDVEITLQILDENPKKKTTEGATVIGDNIYYTMYTSQVTDQLAASKMISLKEGDNVTVKVKNKNNTIAVQLRNWAYKVTGNDSSTITAEASGIVTKTAN